MKISFLFTAFLILLIQCNPDKTTTDNRTSVNDIVVTDNYPDVFRGRSELTDLNLKHEASYRFAVNQIPQTLDEVEAYKVNLRNSIIQKAGIIVDHELPLNYEETGVVSMSGYAIKNIVFQTRPGVYATASLYVPEGSGPFPAVVAMHGHWAMGKLDEDVQSLGHTLASSGYVCLLIDAFGSGERATTHGDYEYHGSGLGASLMNVGESLLGFQVSDNMRGVDLLLSLPYVDGKNIGATGASGGGNQTLWLTAVDERIKASVPVVSIGTFEGYVLRSNCVCELLVDGLTMTESSGVLSLIAPRALKMLNHLQDNIPAFHPSEMQKTYAVVKPVFALYGKENNIDYQLFDLTHGYWKEDREAMLGWFNLHLKGTGDGKPIKETEFKTVPPEQLMVYPLGFRDPKISNIPGYCKHAGKELRDRMLSTDNFDIETKKTELRDILRLKEKLQIQKVHKFSSAGGWERIAIETTDKRLIPLLHIPSRNKNGVYTIIVNSEGKNRNSAAHINSLIQKGYGIIIADMLGTGEVSSSEDAKHISSSLVKFHTLGRAELWLGKTIMGEWVNELSLIISFAESSFNAGAIIVDGTREAGIAALLSGVLKESPVDSLIIREAPVSYLFDNREKVDFYNLSIHLPGFLAWGDVSLASALSNTHVTFIKPLSMSGNSLSPANSDEFLAEYEKMKKACKASGKTIFEI